MVTRVVNYTVKQGLPFERLLIVKMRRTRRVVKPTRARASLRTESGVIIPISAEITSEWGIRLTMSAEETADLPTGIIEWDAFAYIERFSEPNPYVSEPFENYWAPVAKGIMTVAALDNITPLEDFNNMRLTYKQRTDLRRRFAWYGTGSTTVIPAESAYLVAIDAANAVVLDLRWFATAPSEAAIAALPAAQRGYLAPYPGYSLEMHIADSNPIPAGEYRFSLMVRAAGDWDELASGTLAVEFSPASLAVVT